MTTFFYLAVIAALSFTGGAYVNDNGRAVVIGLALTAITAAGLALSLERDREIADAMRRHPAGGRS